MEKDWEVIVVGAGPAGLSAALTLGRCRREVLLCDRGTPRNWATKEMHGFLTRDAIKPSDFSKAAHFELDRYPSLEFSVAEVVSASRVGLGFEVRFESGEMRRCKKLLLATGLFDELPKVEGIDACFGKSVFQCPYCDGWEMQDRPIAAYGKGVRGLEMARALTAWTADIVLCSDGPSGLSEEQLEDLYANRIQVIQDPIKALHGEDGILPSKIPLKCRDN